MDAETERYKHCNTHYAVQNDAPHHGLWKLDGGIL